ncbi:MAG: hypothetical protein JWM53_6423 [bacterium]|nr:hypothetical protein [bacterium]
MIAVGQLLIEMQATGARADQGGDKKSKLHDATLIAPPTLADLGMEKTQAKRCGNEPAFKCNHPRYIWSSGRPAPTATLGLPRNITRADRYPWERELPPVDIRVGGRVMRRDQLPTPDRVSHGETVDESTERRGRQ